MAESEYYTFRITRVVPEPEETTTDDWVKISQPPWPEEPDGGMLAWFIQEGVDFTAVTTNDIADYFEAFNLCNDDGELEIPIHVTRSSDNIKYTMSASHGKFKNQVVQGSGATVTTYLVEDESSYDLGVVPDSGSFSWEGDIFNSDNEVMDSPPSIEQDGSILTWGGESVTGTIAVDYSSRYNLHTLILTARDEGDYDPADPMSAYASNVYATWEHGVETHEVDLPSLSETGCLAGSAGSSSDDPSSDKCYDLYEERDKCTDELLSEELVEVTCPDDDEDEEEGDS